MVFRRRKKENLDLVDKKIQQSKKIKDDLVKKSSKKLDKTLKSSKYRTDELILRSSLGENYHDLIDSKDELQSKYQRKYNQTYHEMDVELYKLNKKIDGHLRKSTANVEHKVEIMEEKIRRGLL